ncbi:hypothetical protein [Streptomyces mirabilis]|uniref:hypothetical protein n=1 Tax=Streptomyces mirabilis TaxID=68239 RepID=UPI0035D8F346
MHITEFTRALADRLPGWQPDQTTVPIATDPASDRIWDSGPLPYAAFETANKPGSCPSTASRRTA